MNWNKYVFYILVLLLFGYLVAGQILLPKQSPEERGLCEDYTGIWRATTADGDTYVAAVPGVNFPGQLTLETLLPETLHEETACMCLRAGRMRAYLDGVLVFDNTEEGISRLSGKRVNRYEMIPIDPQDAGRTLRVELTTSTGFVAQPYLGEQSGILMHILQRDIDELVLLGLAMIGAILLILISLVYGWLNREQICLAYLGWGVVAGGIWMVCDSLMGQILFSDAQFAGNLEFLAVLLLPFPFLVYMDLVQEGRYTGLYKGIGVALAAVDLVCCGLGLAGINLPMSRQAVVIQGLLAVVVSVLYTFYRDLQKKKLKTYPYVALGGTGLILAALAGQFAYFRGAEMVRNRVCAVGLIIALVGGCVQTVEQLLATERKKQEALIAGETKNRFLANMSHEIRTPINAVLGMDEMILRETKESQTREYARDIQRAGQSLLAVVNDILDIEKLNMGRVEITPRAYDFSSMIYEALGMVGQKARAKHLELGVNLDEGLPSGLYGDDAHIRQALINILNNAVKYTNEGGAVLSVSGRREGDRITLHFQVEDTGIGIKEEDMPKLFEAFTRIEEERNRNVEGTGLGISITSQLLHMMGSKLEVRSTYGEGSCFFFDLEQGIVDDTPIGNLSEQVKRQESGSEYRLLFTAPQARILVVDDNAINRKVLRNLLKETLVQIDEADSGAQCLQKIRHTKYDLIFLDHRMPEMDGIETLHAFADLADNLNANTPVVAMTANAAAGAREMYLGNGFQEFLTKPMIVDQLYKTLLKFLPAERIEVGKMHFAGAAPNSDELSQLLESLPEIDLEYAYLHNDSPQMLYELLVDFVRIMETDAEELERYAKAVGQNDQLKSYQIKVHSMKTSAAMIGAVSLSGMARMLELAAVNERLDTIARVTPVFLEEWRSYKEKLRPVMERETQLAKSKEKLAFNAGVVSEQLFLLQTALADMDVDRADGIVNILAGFAYPEEYQPVMDGIYAAVRNLDAEKVTELVGKMPGPERNMTEN